MQAENELEAYSREENNLEDKIGNEGLDKVIIRKG